MKKLIIAAACLAALGLVLTAAPTTNAPSVILGWTASPSTNVIGYHLYWGPAPRQYTNFLTVTGNVLQAQVTNLVRGSTYYFTVTAFATNLESDYCNEVGYTPALIPDSPTNVVLTIENP